MTDHLCVLCGTNRAEFCNDCCAASDELHEAEVERLRAALTGFLSPEYGNWIYDVDNENRCIYCDAILERWEYAGWVGTENGHAPDCPVTMARAALKDTTP